MKLKRTLIILSALLLCASQLFSCTNKKEEENIKVSENTEVSSIQSDSVDYSDMKNWAYYGVGEDKKADLFIVCPTVDMGKKGNLTADINDEKYRESFVGALNMELGIYSDTASIYAPFYRQATFPVYNLDEDVRERYLQLAYEDVKDAFIHFANNTDSSRPIILAGFSQGSDLVIRLMKDLFDEEKYSSRLVAAYCPGWILTEEEVAKYPHLSPAKGETDTGVIVLFNTESESVYSSIIVGEDEKSYCINPLNWRTDSNTASRELNLGACFTDYSGSIEKELPYFTGAYIDRERGTLKVTDIYGDDYSSSLFDDGVYHLYDYQFFFRNLQNNVKKRVEAFTGTQSISLYIDGTEIWQINPVEKNGAVLVPFTAFAEALGCKTEVFENDGKYTATAHKAESSLSIYEGNDTLYFNGAESKVSAPLTVIDGTVYASVKDIADAFAFEILADKDTKSIYVNNKQGHFGVRPLKLSETELDENGEVLINATVFYPFLIEDYIEDYDDQLNEESEFLAEEHICKALEYAEEAELHKKQVGDDFVPYELYVTYEVNYNSYGYISITEYEYCYLGGAHPTVTKSSRTISIRGDGELPLADILDEDELGMSLREYIYDLFSKKLAEYEIPADDDGYYSVLDDEMGDIGFYLTDDATLVLYFNAGQIAPYAVGEISVEIPYNVSTFIPDMRADNLDHYTFEFEYYEGHELIVADYTEEKLSVTVEDTVYPEEMLKSEYSPIGIIKITVTGKEKGNAELKLANVQKGKDVSTANYALNTSFIVDDDGKISIVTDNNDLGELAA